MRVFVVFFFFSFFFFFYWRKTKCTRDSHLVLFAHICYQSLTFDVLRLSVIPYSKRLKNSITHDAHCLAQASSPLEFCNIIAQIIHLFFLKSSFLRRKKWKLEGTDVITESGLRVGDMFGFDNEVAVSTLFFFLPDKFWKRLQSKCCIMSKSCMPPLPFLLFCLLHCWKFQNETNKNVFCLEGGPRLYCTQCLCVCLCVISRII